MPIESLPLFADGTGVTRIIQGFGSLITEEPQTAAALPDYLDACMDAGIYTFDLAAVYAGGLAEEIFGDALSKRPGLRERITLITKYGIEGGGPGYHCYDTSKEAIIRSAERSLRRLQTDRIDLLLMHRPDMLMDAGEVAGALETLHRDGKIRGVGVSNFLPFQTDLLTTSLSLPILVNEIPYSLLDMTHDEAGTLAQCQAWKIRPLFYAPLGGGRLFAPPEGDESALRLRAALEDIAASRGVAMEAIAIAWVLRHPARGAAILGCGRKEWMRSAAKGADIALTRDEWFRLWTAAKGHEIP